MGKIIFLAISLLWVSPVFAQESILIDDFENGLSPGWREKSFKGHTVYTVMQDGKGHVLKAESRGTASGLVFPIETDLKEHPVLSWRWRVDAPVAGGDARRKSGDDYAARLYVIFPHWFFPKTRTLNYIWANRLPKGSVVPNPFTSRAMMIAVETGSESAGSWVAERRNVIEDYRRAFGEDPPHVGAVAIMTDTDNTGRRAVGWYDDIRLEQEW